MCGSSKDNIYKNNLHSEGNLEKEIIIIIHIVSVMATQEHQTASSVHHVPRTAYFKEVIFDTCFNTK
jgi:hypothetical protein